jgi:RNA polymerase sigma-70 factor (ECF subfamily)
MTSTAAELHLLADHAAFLRGVARRLVHDGHAADDLVQETFVRALQHRGRPVGSLRGWLATIVRNVFRDERDAARARERRERDCAAAAAAREEPVGAGGTGGTDDPFGIEQLEAALRALPAPYRHVLHARYYAQQSPPAIAAALGVPLATVKTRLQRALELLRQDMVTRCGGERRLRGVLAPLIGAATTAPVAPWVGAGSLVMANKAMLGAAAVLTLAGAWWMVPRGEPDGPAAVRSSAGLQPATAANGGGAAASRDAATVGDPRDAGGAGAARVAAAPPAAARGISGRVVYASTGDGVPFLPVDVSHGDRNERVTTGRDGAFAFVEAWPLAARLSVAGLAPAAAVRAAATPLAAAPTAAPPAGAALEPVAPVALAGGGSLAVRPPSPTAAASVPRDDASIELAKLGAGPLELRVKLPPTWLVRLPAATVDAVDAGTDLRLGVAFTDRRDGIGTWWPAFAGLAPLQRAPGGELWWCRRDASRVADAPELIVASADGLWFGSVPVPRTNGVIGPLDVALEARGGLRGTVRDAHGAPVAGAHVHAVVATPGGVARAADRTDASGAFLLAHLPAGAAAVYAGGERVDANGTTVDVVAGRVVPCELTIGVRPPGGEVRGTIRTTSGTRLPAAVWLTSRADGSIWRTADVQWRPGPNGMQATFAFADVPGVACDVTLRTSRPCAVDTVRKVCTPPAVDLVFDVDDRVATQNVRFVRQGAAAVGSPWRLEVQGDTFSDSRCGAATEAAVDVALPVGQRVRWCAVGPGHRASRGELLVGGEPATVAVPAERGWSACVGVMDIASFFTPAGVEVFADGVSAGTTDANGMLWLDLPAPPGALTLDAAHWRVYHDAQHRSGVDPVTGAWTLNEHGGVSIYAERVR